MTTGVVTAYFIFPPNFQFDKLSIEKYGRIIRLDNERTAAGCVVEFKTKELSEYFWNNWSFDYKFETND